MKRKAYVLILCMLLVFSTGCQRTPVTPVGSLIVENMPTDISFHPETDCSYQLMSSLDGNTITETENGYYLIANEFLVFTDYDTMTTVPVCAKPNCRHNLAPNQDELLACNAYFRQVGGILSSIFYYNGDLYIYHGLGKDQANGLISSDSFFSQYCALTRISPDGSQRKTIQLIENPLTGYSCIHRGRFYVFKESFDEQGLTFTELWSYSLVKPTEEPQCVYRSKGLLNATNTLVTEFFAYGNYLYFREEVESGKFETKILDLLTNEWTVLGEDENQSSVWSFIANQSLMTYFRDPTVVISDPNELDNKSLYKVSIDGSSAELLGNYPFGNVAADNEYIYMSDPYVGNRTEMKMHIYDHDMNLIDEFSYKQIGATDETLRLCTVHPTQKDRVVFKAGIRWEVVYFYFDRSEIGSGNILLKEFFRYHIADYDVTTNNNISEGEFHSKETTTSTTTVKSEASSTEPSTFPSVDMDLRIEGFSTENTYCPDTDVSYVKGSKTLYVEELERYYVFDGNYLLYADADTSSFEKLCFIADCVHASDNCDAYFSNYYVDLFDHNGRIYLFVNDDVAMLFSLISMEPDGNDRQTLFQIPMSTASEFAGASCIHRGRAYYTRTIPDGDRYVSELWSFELESPDAEHLCIYRSSGLTANWCDMDHLSAYGNYLYWRQWLANDVSARVSCMLDLSTGEWSVIQTPDSLPKGYYFHQYEIIDGELWIWYVSQEDVTIKDELTKRARETKTAPEYHPLRCYVYSMALDGSDLKLVSDNAPYIGFSDGSYIYVEGPRNAASITESFYVYDHNLEQIATISIDALLSDDLEKGNSTLLTFAEDNILLRLSEMRDGDIQYSYYALSKNETSDVFVPQTLS